MKRVDISIPSDFPAGVVGFLYDSQFPQERGQDMLEVTLDNGFLIDAGWYPEGDPAGSYVVTVTRGLEVFLRKELSDVWEAAQCVEILIPKYAKPFVPLANSSDSPFACVNV